DHIATEPRPGMEPRLDPLPLLPLLAEHTKGLGLIGTMSTSFYLPFVLARLVLTADHLSQGRVGWNIITTSEDYAAQAAGTGDAQPKHDDRYGRADEFVNLVKELWTAWDPDAVTWKLGGSQYVDSTKMNPVNFDGDYYKSKNGVLNLARSMQNMPILSQAGSSERGKLFGATHADTILASTSGANSAKAMKDFRDDVRKKLVEVGRDPDSCKILFLVTPIVGRTNDEAEATWNARFNAPATDDEVRRKLSSMAYTKVDLSYLDLDAPLPEKLRVEDLTEGHQGTLQGFFDLSDGGRRTIREMVTQSKPSSLDLWGTPEKIADEMQAVMEEVGGDGFLLNSNPLTRRYITEVTEGLVPELQRRGLTRTNYSYSTMRENLMEF
ncbi:MAG: FMNH2-dependent monooxygenase, partial [Microbacteriaceae bacterium]|nr:FMNH2-dependent monooxygenase [Microbacteriaceae bacterium]